MFLILLFFLSKKSRESWSGRNVLLRLRRGSFPLESSALIWRMVWARFRMVTFSESQARIRVGSASGECDGIPGSKTYGREGASLRLGPKCLTHQRIPSSRQQLITGYVCLPVYSSNLICRGWADTDCDSEFTCPSGFHVAVYPVTSALCWSKESHRFSVCLAFSYCEDRSIDFQALYMSDLELQILHFH